jgi:hypothetical protein
VFSTVLFHMAVVEVVQPPMVTQEMAVRAVALALAVPRQATAERLFLGKVPRVEIELSQMMELRAVLAVVAKAALEPTLITLKMVEQVARLALLRFLVLLFPILAAVVVVLEISQPLRVARLEQMRARVVRKITQDQTLLPIAVVVAAVAQQAKPQAEVVALEQ